MTLSSSEGALHAVNRRQPPSLAGDPIPAARLAIRDRVAKARNRALGKGRIPGLQARPIVFGAVQIRSIGTAGDRSASGADVGGISRSLAETGRLTTGLGCQEQHHGES